MTRSLLWSAVLFAVACGKNPDPPVPPGDKIWLQDIHLLTERDGREVRFVAGPRLVTVAADGRVEAVGATLGYIDARATVVPGGGMILYAARTTVLADLKRRELVWGKLQAGAQVAVRPVDGGYEVAPGPPFGEQRFFVAREDLSAEPIPRKVGPRGTTFCGSVRWRPEAGVVVGWTDPCLPVQLGPEPGRVRQQLLGVELDGRLVDEDRAWCTPGSSYAARHCMAETVVESDQGRRWMPAPLAVARPVDGLPEGHLAIEKSTRLGRHFEDSDEVFVKRWEGGAAVCSSLAEFPSRKDPLSPNFSIGADPTRASAGAGMEVGHIETGTGYIVVAATDDHVDMLAPDLPDGALSYVTSDVERWFFTKKACESVGERNFRLHQDPAL